MKCFRINYKQNVCYVKVSKRPVLNNIGRFVFQWFKNILGLDFYPLFISIEMVILASKYV